MRKLIYTSLALLCLSGLYSYSSGVFSADYTGSTGLGQSCAQVGCHEGAGGTSGVDSSRLYVRVLDASNNDISTYATGQQYTIEIRFKLLGATRVGFQCPALFLFSTAKAGTVSNTLMPSMVQIYTDGSGREYVSHTTAGNGSAVMSGGYAIWKYTWTAPAAATDAIGFHCAVNRSNADNDKTGDSIFISTRILQKPTAVNDVRTAEAGLIFPNTCTNSARIRGYQRGYGAVQILNLCGQAVATKQPDADGWFSTGELAPGQYLAVLETEGKRESIHFSKQP